MAYDNTNSGIMYRVDDRKSERHPEFTGSINVNGEDFWLSGWVNEGKPGGKMEGKKYFSIKLNRKEGGTTTGRPMSDPGFVSDDIPF